MPHPLDWLDDALADLDRRGLRRTLADAQSARSAATESSIGGQSLVNFGSNDYLGLAADPRIDRCGSERRSRQNGWGSGASPLVTRPQ